MNTTIKRLFILLAILILAGCGSQEPANLPLPTPNSEEFVIDPAYQLGEISPNVFGVNHGPWAFVTTKVYQNAVEGGFTFIRFPGGNWGDLNTMTGREVEAVAQLADQIGAELSISVRLKGGTPEVAADLVKMVNQELGLGVRYWSIGNEPALFDDYDTVQHNKEWRAIAEAMLAVDPNILLIGPDVTQFTGNDETDPKDANGLLWIDEFLKQNGDLVDVISIHRYPFPKSMDAQSTIKEDLYASVSEWETIIPSLRSKISEFAGKDLPIAVTEVNSHWTNATSQPASPDSFANTIWWAGVLSQLITQEVDIVTYFSLQSNASVGGYGLFERYGIRPTYYVYQIFKGFGHTRIYTNSPDSEVTAIASQCEDGDITAVIVNHSLQGKEYPLAIPGMEELQNIQAMLLADGIWAEEVPLEEHFDGSTVFLPAESVLRLSFSADAQYCSSISE